MVSLIVAGATGAVGRTVVQAAICEEMITTVVALTRSSNIDKANYPALFGLPADHVHVHKIKPTTVDWEELLHCWQMYKSAQTVDALAVLRRSLPHFHEMFSRLEQLFRGHTLAAMCMGSTYADEGSAAGFARSDYDYVIVFTEALLTFSAPAGGLALWDESQYHLQNNSPHNRDRADVVRPGLPDKPFKYRVGDNAPVLSIERLLSKKSTELTPKPSRKRSYNATEPQSMSVSAYGHAATLTEMKSKSAADADGRDRRSSSKMNSMPSQSSRSSRSNNNSSLMLDELRVFDEHQIQRETEQSELAASQRTISPALALLPTEQQNSQVATYPSSPSVTLPVMMHTTATLRAMDYVSSFTASRTSWILYARTKGCAEAAVEERVNAHNERSTRNCETEGGTNSCTPFAASTSTASSLVTPPPQVALTFLRPGLLDRNTKSRVVEKIASYFTTPLPVRQCGLCIVADLLQRAGLRSRDTTAVIPTDEGWTRSGRSFGEGDVHATNSHSSASESGYRSEANGLNASLSVSSDRVSRTTSQASKYGSPILHLLPILRYNNTEIKNLAKSISSACER